MRWGVPVGVTADWGLLLGGDARMGAPRGDRPEGRPRGHRRGGRREAERALRRPRVRHPAESRATQVVHRGKPGTAAPAAPARREARRRPDGVLHRRARCGRRRSRSWVAKYGEAVISIETPSGKGSGFIINDDGYAVTNNHVIQGETRIAAVLYQNVSSGLARRRIENVEIVALNPFVDLALLEAAAPEGPETQPRGPG